MNEHLNENVRRAVTALADALCEWERMSGIQSVLIIREQGDFSFRAQSGKPGIPEDVTDAMLLDTLQ